MEQITVPVKGGKLIATPNNDPNYPGIDIEFVPDKEKDWLSNPRVTVEYPNDDQLQAIVWEDREKEDSTDTIYFPV